MKILFGMRFLSEYPVTNVGMDSTGIDEKVVSLHLNISAARMRT